jgi:16S rRNA processing protein RimM
MGRVAAPYAIRGWIKVQPFTEYVDSLLDYPVWQIGKSGRWKAYELLEARVHGQFLLAQLKGVEDRSAAEAMLGLEIAVARSELPPAGEDEYYWDDLIGLDVVNLAGESLGKVEGLLETGAHDVLKVTGDRERLIPFKAPIVVKVDLEAGKIEVDWGLDW